MIENKEVGMVKAQATRLVTAANALTIDSKETLEQATDILSKVKTVGKEIKARKEEITKPLMEALNSARDLFKSIEASHAEAERIIKGKMGEYMDEQERIERAEKDRIAAQAEAGRIRPETAIRKMDAVEEAPRSAQGEVGSIARRTLRKVRVVDESLIPRAYLVPNMALINEHMLKGGIEVAGCEVYEEKSISAR